MAQLDGFVPSKAPASQNQELSDLATWVEDELSRVAAVLQETSILKLVVLNVAPPKPREGMIVYADGTNWNPGSGAGPYARIGTTWTKLFP